jgi:hypothetical protein
MEIVLRFITLQMSRRGVSGVKKLGFLREWESIIRVW